ncbi:hypothetical protein ALCH109712_05325 [Alkalicoccus chagannorensis]
MRWTGRNSTFFFPRSEAYAYFCYNNTRLSQRHRKKKQHVAERTGPGGRRRRGAKREGKRQHCGSRRLKRSGKWLVCRQVAQKKKQATPFHEQATRFAAGTVSKNERSDPLSAGRPAAAAVPRSFHRKREKARTLWEAGGYFWKIIEAGAHR